MQRTVVALVLDLTWLLAVSALRVYAINGRSLVMPLIIILLFLMYTSYDLVSAFLRVPGVH